MAITAGPLRVVRLGTKGCPTGETVEVDGFDIKMTEAPSDDSEKIFAGGLKEINFTMELCWGPGHRRSLVEAIAGPDFWKHCEHVRKRYRHQAKKTRKRQR